MRNFEDTFETHKRCYISAFSICMTVPVNVENGLNPGFLKETLELRQTQINFKKLKFISNYFDF